MTIQEEDFKLEFDESCYRFDLYLPHVVNASNEDKKRIEFKIVSNSSTIENCIKKIINYRINNSSDFLTMKEYLQLYKSEADKLLNLFEIDYESVFKK